jgi:predicted amidohydrolase YtcJ
MYSGTFMKVLTILLTLAVAVTGTFSPSQREFQSAGNVIAIRNVTVIPGNGAAPINDATVLIRGEYIAAIGSSAEMVVPKGARVIDGRGKFLVPGFIEMHAHLSKTRASALGLFIANGVTTESILLILKILSQDLRDFHD